MRVTTNTFPNTLLNQLGDLTRRQSKLQDQAATGQLVRFPDDDPSAMRRILDMQDESKSVGQYRDNILTLKEASSTAYAPIKALKTISDRAGEIAVLTDDLKSPTELQSFANEISQLIQQAVELANVKHRGGYLFSGTSNDQKAFNLTTDANGFVTSVTYGGNDKIASSEVAEGVTLSPYTPGQNNSGSGPRGLITDSRSGADFFNHLIDLQNNVQAGNTNAVHETDLPNLLTDEENFLYHMSTNGSIQARLESADTIASQRTHALEREISKQADADLAQTLVRLNETNNAYQAALQGAGKILNQSLLDYIR